MTYSEPLRYGSASRYHGKEPNYLTADGWELVKQSLGYLHHDNTTASGSISVTDDLPMRYVMLYNRFSGVLRILGFYQWDSYSTGVMVTRLELNDLGPAYITDPSDPKPNNFSGIFSLHGQHLETLDKKTKITTVESTARFLGGNRVFWSDFQLTYDPCVCFFDSYINVTFLRVISSTVNLYGGSVSCNSTACPNPDDLTDYLGGFFRDPLSTQLSSISNYGSKQQMMDELHAMVYNQTNYLEDKDGLWQKLQEYGEYAEKAGEYLEYIPNEYTEIAAQALKYGGMIMKFVGKTKESPLGKATKEFTALSGTVTTTTNPEALEFRMATPGSPWSRTVAPIEPEFSKAPVWPVYNENLGVFAVLNQPKVKVFEDQGPYKVYLSASCSNTIDIDHSSDGGRTAFGINFNASDLKYIFNPITELKDYSVKAAIQVTYSYGTGTIAPSCNTSPFVIPEPIFTNMKRIKLDPGTNRATATYETTYVDVGCTQNMSAYIYYPTGTVLNFYGFAFWPTLESVEIKLLVTGASTVLDRFNTPNVISHLYTLKPEIVSSTDASVSIMPTATGSGYQGIPFNRTFNGYFQPANGTVTEEKAIEAMILGGTFTNLEVNGQSHPIPITFSAGDKIEFKPGFEITAGEFEFIIKSPFDINCPTIVQQTPAFVTDFCLGSAPSGVHPYKANSPFTREVVSNSNVLPNPSATTLSYPMPNPTSGTSTLSFNLAENSAWNMQLCNAMGVHLKTVGKKDFSVAGKYSVDIDTKDLEAGVYFITFTSEGFRQARKLVVVR